MKHALLCVISLCVWLATQPALAENYPERDITNVVVWSAGGGTDTANRIVTAEMNEFLPTRINVVNKPGGVAGSIGMSFVDGQPADGYTLVGLSESNVTAAVQGGWDKTFDIWYPFIIGGSPDVLSVNASSPYKTLDDLVKASKQDPKAIKAAAGGSGSIHHLNLLAFEKGSGAKLNFIPYPGSAPGQNAAMTGEVSVVVTSLAEQQQLLKAGKLRPLGMLVEDAMEIEGVGSIPSAFEAYPGLRDYLPIIQTIGFAVSSDAPQNVKETLSAAFKKALETDAVKDWAANNFYQLSGKTGDAASEQFSQLESLFAWTLHDLGATKVSPEQLGIERP